MKTSLYMLLLVICGVFTAQAQQPITADEAHGAAASAAGDAIDNPQLLGTATFSGNYNIPDFGEVAMEFNLSDGTGTVWGFVFEGQSKTDGKDTTVSYGVAKILFFPVAIPLDLETVLPPEFLNFLSIPLQNEWINSSEMAVELRDNPVLTTYLEANNDPAADAVVLSEIEASISPITGTVWQAIWIGGGSGGMVCYVHAVSGETYCENLAVGVHENIASEVSLAPNPTQDVVVVRADVSNITQCYIINAQGQTVATVNANNLHNISYGLGIPVHELSSGMYFLVLETAEGRALKPIEIQR